MTLGEDIGPDSGGDDLLAAEYVVGVLPPDERRTASERIERDGAFARLVDAWQGYFAPLAMDYPPAEAPAAVKVAIDRRLFSGVAAPVTATARGGLWSSLAFWRGLATAALAALVLYVGSTLLQTPAPQQPPQQLVASLAADGSDVKFVALYDPARGEVGLSKLSGEPGADRVYELWMIEGKNPPVSMGVIPGGATSRLSVGDEDKAKLAAGAILAISLEPPGGSPTGQPTGPVVAAGDLNNI